MILLIGLLFLLISMGVQQVLKSKFRKYGKMQLWANLSGAEIAHKMLADHGIVDVQVVTVPGKLSDHYNPTTKTVNLSPDVYNGRNAAAAAVAAHEVGHAVQHAKAYAWLGLRSAMVPVVNFSSQFINTVVMLSIFGSFVFHLFDFQFIIIGMIAAQGIVTVFSLVTLPVEYDASNRALKWIQQYNVVTKEEYGAAKDALNWAARTYLVAAIGSIAYLAFYILRFLGSND